MDIAVMRRSAHIWLAVLLIALASGLGYAAFPFLYQAATSCPLSGQIGRIADQEVLFDLAIRCDDADKRLALVTRLSAQDRLREIALERSEGRGYRAFRHWDVDLRMVAIRKLVDPETLREIGLRKQEHPDIVRLAVSRLEEPDFLESIATHGGRTAQDAALAKLTDEERIARALIYGASRSRKSTPAETQAVIRLQRPDVLETIAREVAHEAIGRLAVGRIDDIERLKRIASQGTQADVRLAALEKLSASSDIASVILTRYEFGDDAACAATRRIKELDVLADLLIQQSRVAAKHLDMTPKVRIRDCRWYGNEAMKRLVSSGDETLLATVAAQGATFALRGQALAGIRDEEVLKGLERELAAAAIPADGHAPGNEGSGPVLRLVRNRLRVIAAVEGVRRGEYDEADARTALRVLIAGGETSSLPLLKDILWKFGDKSMLDLYLNAGSSELADLARTYARSRGYRIRSVTIPGNVSVGGSWGSGRH